MIDIFMISMYQRTMWNQCGDVKGVARSGEPTESYYLHLQLPLASWSFIVPAYCLDVQPATLLFLFTLTAFFWGSCGSVHRAGRCVVLAPAPLGYRSVAEPRVAPDAAFFGVWINYFPFLPGCTVVARMTRKAQHKFKSDSYCHFPPQQDVLSS